MKNQNHLKVGQKIYLLHKTKTKIIPCQVIEEVIKRSLKGELTSYRISTGSEELLLEAIPDVIIFENLQDAKKFLTDRIISTIDELIFEIEKNTVELFGSEDMPFSEAEVPAE